MNIFDFLKQNKKISLSLFLILALMVMSFLLVLIKDAGKDEAKEEMQPKKTYETISPTSLIKKIINNKDQKLLENKTKLLSKETLSDGSIKYTFSSSSLARNTVIITKNDQITYERISTSAPYPKINEFVSTHGEPEITIPGYVYGEGSEIFVFPSSGFSVTYNPSTGNVLEIQVFPKTTREKYKEKYENDLYEVN